MRLALVLVLPLAACAADKGVEEDVPVDGKLDSFHIPTDHGALVFGTSALGKLTATQAYHTWTFGLPGAASIHAHTLRAQHAASIDTVLYLYKQGPTGWGSYLVRNDDDGTSEWSSIERALDPGTYRLLVKGYASSTRGSFLVEADCTGAGCAASCLFGGSLGDLEADPAFTTTDSQRLYSSVGVSALDAQRMVLAMQESSHTDVTTVDQAFAAADQHEIDVTRITHTPSGRTFTIVDYGAGDNTYGAIFTGDTADLATAIHDSDFYRCAVN